LENKEDINSVFAFVKYEGELVEDGFLDGKHPVNCIFSK
jgi:hypothetical protein